MTFQDVLKELQIDQEELERLVSNAELRGIRTGNHMEFARTDVMNLKQEREIEPTIMVSDSDQETGIAEGSDLKEDPTSNSVIPISEIVGRAHRGSHPETPRPPRPPQPAKPPGPPRPQSSALILIVVVILIAGAVGAAFFLSGGSP